jgi:hypothetical protein
MGSRVWQAAEERGLIGKCGNPLCGSPIDVAQPKVKYRAMHGTVVAIRSSYYCRWATPPGSVAPAT